MVRAASTRVSIPLPTGASAYRIDMPDENTVYSDIKAVSKLFDENSASQNAMWMGRETFNNVYKYVIRYFERYFVSACKVLFTVVFEEDNMDEGMRIVIVDTFKDLVQSHLRHSDIMVCPSSVQVFLVLPEVEGAEINRVTDRIISAWKACEYSGVTKIQCETESIYHSDEDRRSPEKTDRTDSVVIVDDNKANLSIASLLLKKDGLITHTLQSGRALLDFLKTNHPDLILLDVMMPEMDGFETFKRIKGMGGQASRIPVIFLTAEENKEIEIEGITLGAIDFIRKPFVPEVLTARVKLAINLIRLQNHLEDEVYDRILENERMSIHIIQSLADAIEAKDLYTNGHSDRVANYSREIARRYGYEDKQIKDIYMMGLLHDVGKIGVPNAIINKPGKLTDEEFSVIKTHPENGYKILNNIKEMPKLANGARWHHERFDGRGYPDGLKGEEIPEEARIIAVADAYDAMTSNRSYREPMSQERVKGEIIKGRGSQFDPKFADIMIEMIEEDDDYSMREM